MAGSTLVAMRTGMRLATPVTMTDKTTASTAMPGAKAMPREKTLMLTLCAKR